MRGPCQWPRSPAERMLGACQDEASRPRPGRVRTEWTWSLRVSGHQGARRSEPPVTRQTSTKEITMFTLHRPPTVIPAFVAILTFALSAPIAVHAQDQMLADEASPRAEDDPGPGAGQRPRGVRPVAIAPWKRAARPSLSSLPDDSVRANSDDRIANALFGDKCEWRWRRGGASHPTPHPALDPPPTRPPSPRSGHEHSWPDRPESTGAAPGGGSWCSRQATPCARRCSPSRGSRLSVSCSPCLGRIVYLGRDDGDAAHAGPSSWHGTAGGRTGPGTGHRGSGPYHGR